jgi:hypothetical protein
MGHEGPYGCETSRFPYFLDTRLVDDRLLYLRAGVLFGGGGGGGGGRGGGGGGGGGPRPRRVATYISKCKNPAKNE